MTHTERKFYCERFFIACFLPSENGKKITSYVCRTALKRAGVQNSTTGKFAFKVWWSGIGVFHLWPFSIQNLVQDCWDKLFGLAGENSSCVVDHAKGVEVCSCNRDLCHKETRPNGLICIFLNKAKAKKNNFLHIILWIITRNSCFRDKFHRQCWCHLWLFNHHKKNYCCCSQNYLNYFDYPLKK